ncbi:hypothetical protein KC350_g20 [Hortaea werneckii]|nr:hypothetical protein KC350_g20 [Hortaea werneckii]
MGELEIRLQESGDAPHRDREIDVTTMPSGHSMSRGLSPNRSQRGQRALEMGTTDDDRFRGLPSSTESRQRQPPSRPNLYDLLLPLMALSILLWVGRLPLSSP